MKLMKGVVRLWHSSRVMPHYDVFLENMMWHNSLKSSWFTNQNTGLTMVKPDSTMINECWPWLNRVNHDLLMSNMADYGQTKFKHGLPKSAIVCYNVWCMSTQPHMWHINNVTFKVHPGLCHIANLPFPQRKCIMKMKFMKGVVRLWHSSRVMSHFDVFLENMMWHNSLKNTSLNSSMVY